MKRKVILTRKYQDEAIRQLRETFNLNIVEDSGKTLPEIIKENPDTEALISFLSDKIDQEIMDLAPNLKIIANYAVGYNNIDIGYAVKKGIPVTNTPDVLTNATADLTMALILATCRRLVEGDELLRQGKFKGWGANFLLGKELNGSILGIIGMGRIGQATALRAKGFGLTITYYNRNRKPDLEKEHGYRFKPLFDLVKEADIVSLHIPASPGVYHLFNKDMFDRMKKDAVFINVSRGDLVDEAYLAEKLAKNELFGAGLDVYEHEPHVTEQLIKLKNVVLAPHIGSATYKARMGMAQLTVDNVKQALAGIPPQNLVPECRPGMKS
ncbi:MAG TPA: D-glycerate dehydrogenase [Candidatus Deferrimicrobium sp.]|nr:D-glycerate dehydrogenase [Candidatus Deferrimicrobium sp.]